MNVTVASRDLLRELELLAKVVAQKPTIPVLANCLVQAEGTGIRLAATDLEIGIVTYCPALVTLPGSTTLPVKHLLEIIKLLPDRDITFELNHTVVKVSSGTYHTRVPIYAVVDYPAMPSMKDLPQLTLPAQFQAMVKRVRFAVSDKEKRYYLNGALLTTKSLAATDGHRLALTVHADSGLEEPVIIPSKALDKLAEMVTPDAIFAVGARHLFFVMDGRLLFSRMVDGKFPNYERIIPTETTFTVSLPLGSLRDALQRIVITSNEVVFKFTQNLLTITGRSAEVGEALEQVAVTYDGEDVVVSLSGTYLLDFLGAAAGPVLTLAWKSGGTLRFTDGDSYCYVQMPMRNV